MNTWNENAKKVQDYHRAQDQPFPMWRKDKTLIRNLAVTLFLAVPFLILVDLTSDK